VESGGPPPEPAGGMSIAERLTELFVRVVGVVLVVVGVWVGIKVVFEAWNLYVEPARVERFAQAVENGSHIDRVLSPGKAAAPAPAGESTGLSGVQKSQDSPASPPRQQPESSVRLSYFIAWVVVLMLLLIIARLAVSMIRTGGELVLYDLQVRRLVRGLNRANGRPRGR